MILHVGVSEPLYYWVHKKFHGDYLFKNYHSLHHSSPVPTPLTGEILRSSIWLLSLITWIMFLEI